MKKVEAYLSEDGKIYKTVVECAKADAAHKIDEGLRNFADMYFYSGMTAADALTIIKEQRNTLYAILKEAHDEFAR